MPIRGLTEARQLPRLGKIKIGKQVPNANGPGTHPEKTDHFIVPPDVLEVLQGLGVRTCECPERLPVEIPIMFPADDLEVIAPQWYKAYRGKAGLACKGDGYTAGALLDRNWTLRNPPPTDTQSWSPPVKEAWSGDGPREELQIACLGEGFDGQPPCVMFASKRCNRSASLLFVIPDAPGIGVYQLDTSSIYSIRNINSSLALLKSATGGRLAGVPVTLCAEAREIRHDGKPTKATIIRLDTALKLRDLARRDPLAIAPATPQLPEPDDAPDNEEEVDTSGPANDIEGLRQRCRDMLAWAHENWSAQDWRDLLGALHGTLADPSAWTERGNLAVSSLSTEAAQRAVAELERRVGGDMRGPEGVVPRSDGDSGEKA